MIPLDDKRVFEQKLTESLNQWEKRTRINRSWDGFLKFATILLTLLLTGLDVESPIADESTRKAAGIIIGGLIVTIQSSANAFPVGRRSEGYRKLLGEALAIQDQLIYLDKPEEIEEKLPTLKQTYNEMLRKAAALG